MKTIKHILTLAILLMFALPMLAAEDEQPIEKTMDLQMEKMHSQMQTMHEQIKEIKTTKDSDKRKSLMHQHMQSMRDVMIMMGETDDVRGGMMKGMTDQGQSQMTHTTMHEKKGRMGCQQDDAPCEYAQSMDDRQEVMQERMKMMQMMMQQMMEHLSVQTQ